MLHVVPGTRGLMQEHTQAVWNRSWVSSMEAAVFHKTERRYDHVELTLTNKSDTQNEDNTCPVSYHTEDCSLSGDVVATTAGALFECCVIQ